MNLKTISRIFYLAAGYDGLLGLIFVLAPYRLFSGAGIEAITAPRMGLMTIIRNTIPDKSTMVSACCQV